MQATSQSEKEGSKDSAKEGSKDSAKGGSKDSAKRVSKDSANEGLKEHKFMPPKREENNEIWTKFATGLPEYQEEKSSQAQVLGGQVSEEQCPHVQVPEEQCLHVQVPEGQAPEGQPKMSSEQINWILFSFALHGRFTKNVIDLIKKVGLPIPEQGSISSIEDLIVKMKTIFIRRIPKMSFEEIKYFLKQLTSDSTLGDENNVFSFPNEPDSKEKFHTLHLECAKDILSALLEQSRTLKAMISECMTLKLDGSCAVIDEEGHLVYAGSRILIRDEVQMKIESILKKIKDQQLKVEKLSQPLPPQMPDAKKEVKKIELAKEIKALEQLEEQVKVDIAYFQKMRLQVEEIEKSKPKIGKTYEVFFLGLDMNDLRTALFPIISGRTIISHDELMILLKQPAQPVEPDSSAQQDPSAPSAQQDPSAQPKQVEDFLNMTNAEILGLLNKTCARVCESKINARRHLTGRTLFCFQPVRILMNEKPKNGVPPTPKYSSVCEGVVLHITVAFPDGTVFRICLKVKNPEMNQEKRNHCVYSETFTEADYYALLKEWLIRAEVPAVLASAGGGQACEL
jgi:hypothetical protein